MNNQMIKTASAITEAESMKFAKGKSMSKSSFEKILNSSEVIKLTDTKDVSSLARPIKQNNVSKIIINLDSKEIASKIFKSISSQS